MCDPTGLTTASLVMAVAGTVASMQASKAQSKFQSNQAEQAAKQEEFRALSQLETTRQEQQAFDKQAAKQRGEQVAAMAASGLDMSSGTLLDVFTNTAREQAIDRQNIGYNGRVAADNYLNSASALNAQASGYKAAGTNAMISGGLSAVGSILGQAGGLFEASAPEITGLDSATKKGNSLSSTNKKSLFNKKY